MKQKTLILTSLLMSLSFQSMATETSNKIEDQYYKLILTKKLYDNKKTDLGEIVYYNKTIKLNDGEQIFDASLLQKKRFESKVLLIGDAQSYPDKQWLFVFWDYNLNQIYHSEMHINLNESSPVLVYDTTCEDILYEKNIKNTGEINYNCKLVGYLKEEKS